MKNIQQMIDAHGGFEAVRDHYLRIENPPFMRLVIEIVSGPLPNGAYEVSVAHYGQQNGDAMKDPEITFLVLPGSDQTTPWHPLTYTNDYLGVYQVACQYDASGALQIQDASLKRDLESFATSWDQTVKLSGFFAAMGRPYPGTATP